MKRKIIQLAQSTLVVSLPTEWVKAQGLDKGDEVECEISDYRIILTPPTKTNILKKIEIDISSINERTLRWQISSLHKQGYDEITLRNYDEEQVRIIEELTNKLFVGFVIRERSSLKVVIGQVAVVAADEFDRTLRQAFRQINTMFEDFTTALKSDNIEKLQYQLEHEQTNNKLTNFCERLLNKSLQQKEKGHFWYVIAWNLEKIADNFKYLVVENTQAKNTKSIVALFSKLSSYYNDYYDCFYSFSFEKLSTLSTNKKEIEKICLDGIRKGGDDAIYYHYAHMMALQIADFSASMIALSFKPREAI